MPQDILLSGASQRMTKVAAVLGSTGFIGSNICAALLLRGWTVKGLVRPGSSRIAMQDLEIEHHPGEIADATAMVSFMRGSDVVFHAAGYNPARSIRRQNETRTAQTQIGQVLQAFERSNAGRLVYTGASCVFWPPEARRRSTLAQVKDASASRIEAAVARALDVVTLIPTHCIGERDAKAVSGALVCALAQRRLLAATTGHISPIDICAVAQAHIDTAETGVRGSVRVVRGPNMQVPDFVRLVADELSVPAPLRKLDPEALYFLGYLGEWICWALRSKFPLSIESIDLLRYTSPVPGEQVSTLADVRAAVRRSADWYRAHNYPAFR